MSSRKVDNALVGLFVVQLIVLGVIVANRPKPTALQTVYGGYNHIRMYEDGSYEGETSDGQYERGCIKGGLCND